MVELVESVLGLKDEESAAQDGEELCGVLQVVGSVAELFPHVCACAVEPVGFCGVVAWVCLDGDLGKGLQSNLKRRVGWHGVYQS